MISEFPINWILKNLTSVEKAELRGMARRMLLSDKMDLNKMYILLSEENKKIIETEARELYHNKGDKLS